MKKYRTYKSAYRDGYRVSEIHICPYDKNKYILKIAKDGDTQQVINTKEDLLNFLGKKNFNLILETKGKS